MSKTSIIFGLGRRALTALLILGLTASVSGCASKYGTQTVQVKYYPDCYAPIAQMRKDEADKTANTVFGVVVGATIGAAIGSQQGGGRGAAIGAISGAIVGGVAANLLTDSIQKKNQAERFAAYSAVLDQDIQGLSNAVAAATLVNKCYENAYYTLKRQYNAGQIGKEEMRARLKELRDGTSDANAVLTNFAAQITKNQEDYQEIQKIETQRRSSNDQLAAFNNKSQQVGRKKSELQHELQRMNSIYNTMDSDYQTINADSNTLRMAALPAAICRPVKM